MDAKDIYLNMNTIIKLEDRTLKGFCRRTNRSYSSLARTFSDVIYNEKGANLNATEKILNDLGYELTVKKIQ